jgi:hypothetical protein
MHYHSLVTAAWGITQAWVKNEAFFAPGELRRRLKSGSPDGGAPLTPGPNS